MPIGPIVCTPPSIDACASTADNRMQSRPGELAGCDPVRGRGELAVAFVAVLQCWYARRPGAAPTRPIAVISAGGWRGSAPSEMLGLARSQHEAYGANGRLLLVCLSTRPLWRELILAHQDHLIGDASRR